MNYKSLESLKENGQAGDWYIEEPQHETDNWSFHLRVPTLDGSHLIDLPIVKGEDKKDHWNWSGDYDKPTLTPEIHAIGVWIGSLIDGKLVA